MDIHSQGGDEEAAAKTDSRGKHRLARPHPLQPLAEHCGRKAKEYDRQAENPRQRGELPVQRVGAVHAGQGFESAARGLYLNQVVQRLLEYAEGVSLANGQMNGKSSGRNQPAAESRFSDRVTTVKKGECTHGLRSSSF